MTIYTRAELATILRTTQRRIEAIENFGKFVEYLHKDDSKPFRHSKFHQFICDKLQATLDGSGSKRLIVNLPPRFGKTTLATISFTAFVLGYDTSKRIMVMSHTSSFSRKRALDIKRTIKSKNYRHLFPSVSVGKDISIEGGGTETANYWEVYDKYKPEKTYGKVSAVGIGSNTQGEGVDVMIIDDLYANRADANSATVREKVWEEFSAGLQSRLAPDAIVIILNTRFHVDDVSGIIIKDQKTKGHNRWEIISLPAIADLNDPLGRSEGDSLWPEEWPLPLLYRKKEDMTIKGNDQDWLALYQQQPSIKGGAIIKRQDWKIWSEADLPDFEYAIMSIDTAMKAQEEKKNSYHAITIWHVFRPPQIKLSWPEVVVSIAKTALTDEELLLQFRDWAYEEKEAIGPENIFRIDGTIKANATQAKGVYETSLRMTADDIRCIRTGQTMSLFLPNSILLKIRASDIELANQFTGIKIPPSLIRKILDDLAVGHQIDMFSVSEDSDFAARYQTDDNRYSKYLMPGDRQYTGDGKVFGWKTVRPNHMLLVDAWHEHCPYSVLRHKVIDLYDKHEKQYKKAFDQVIIEDKALGPLLIHDLHNAGIPAYEYNPNISDKYGRAQLVSPMWGQGRVWALGKLMQSSEGTLFRKNDEFKSSVELVVQECEQFPNGTYNDLVDTTTQAALFVKTTLPFKYDEDTIKLVDEDEDYREPTNTKVIIQPKKDKRYG